MRPDERDAATDLAASVAEKPKTIAPAPIRSVESAHPWLWLLYLLALFGTLFLTWAWHSHEFRPHDAHEIRNRR